MVKALELRARGYTELEISREIGRAQSTTHQILVDALDQQDEQVDLARARYRRLELARLELPVRGLAKLASPSRGKPDLEAVRVWERLSASRRDLLGLDAPTKVAPTDPSG